jgi:hypothetical protein
MATVQKTDSGGSGSSDKGGKKVKVAANEQSLVIDHPSIDCSGRFAVDHLLRESGYIIWSRKGKEIPSWVHKRDQYSSKRKIYTQSQVLSMLPDVLLEDAKYAEELYMDAKFGKISSDLDDGCA